MNLLITGASRGIGAELLAQATQRGDTAIGTSTTGNDRLLQLDVTRSDDIASFASQLPSDPLDTLICNAGIFEDKGQSLDTGYPADMWTKGFATNVTGVFLTVQAVLPQLKRSQTPKIAIISSQMGSDTRAPGGSYIYRASKAAALNLGRNLATDLAPSGIAVGIYHPGWVKTDMGGAEAAISAKTSATGLLDRIAALSLATTGCFETWDGQQHPY